MDNCPKKSGTLRYFPTCHRSVACRLSRAAGGVIRKKYYRKGGNSQMGKGKRSREKNAAEILNTVEAPKKKSSINVWTKVMLVAVALILVASLAITYISTSGILLRAPYALKSENFEINGAMMQYMFMAQYSAFTSNFSSYISYLGLNTSTSLRLQQCSSNYSYILKSAYGDDIYTEGTWFDFFWDLTRKQAKQTLVFCEAAKASGMELTTEEIANIDESIKALDDTATLYGFASTKAYIAAMYGKGINKNDIRETMLLTELSAKYYEAESERILGEIKDDQVNAFFAEHESDYLKADYYSFVFNVSKDAIDKDDTDEIKAEKQEKFEEEIKKAKEHAAAIAAMTDIEEIKDYMINYWMEDYYDSYLKTTQDELKKNDSKTGKPTITDDDIPTDDAVKQENKEKVFAAVKDAIENEKETEDLESMGDTAYDKVLTNLRDKLISQINKNLDSMLSETVSFSDTNDEVNWIFSEERKAGDTKVFNSDDETSDEEEDEDDEEVTSFKSTVYRIEKPRYLQKETVKEFGHILINDGNFEDESHEGHDHATDDEDAISEENDALAKKEAERLLEEFLKGEITKEAFEALAKDKTQDAGGVFYPDTIPGQMVEEMNDWLFAEDRKVNDTEVIKTEYGYHVTWLVEIGDELWFYESKNDYYAELLEKWTDEMEAKTAVTENTKIADKIDA